MATKTLLVLLAACASLQAQGRAVIRTTGQFEPEGTALYGAYVASRDEDLGEVLVAVAVPPGSRFLEVVHQPQGATFEGVQSDVVYWSVPLIERDTLLGPMVFRVKPDGSGATLPASVYAVTAYQRPVSESVAGPPTQGVLQPSADRGSVTFDQRGTLDSSGANAPVPIGNTGAMLFILEGSVDRQVTVTANRLSVSANTLPRTDPPTWWCTLFEFTAEPRVTFSKPVKLALPTRRPVVLGLNVSSVSTSTLDDWSQAPARSAPPPEIGFGAGAQNLRCFVVQFGMITCTTGSGFGFGGFGGFGYVEQDNLRSRVTGSGLSSSGFGSTTAAGLLSSPPSIASVLTRP